MKLYTPPPPDYLMRVSIKKANLKTEHLTLCECTMQECYDFIANVIRKQNLDVLERGIATNIAIREANGADNGKAVSLTFRGLSPLEVKDILLKELNELNKLNNNPL